MRYCHRTGKISGLTNYKRVQYWLQYKENIMHQGYEIPSIRRKEQNVSQGKRINMEIIHVHTRPCEGETSLTAHPTLSTGSGT